MTHDPEDRSFLGHPKGLAYLAFTEAFERFSFYGMQALLVLYMVNALFRPGHQEKVLFLEPMSRLFGGLQGQALASAGLPAPAFDVAASEGALFDDSHVLSRLIGHPTTSLARRSGQSRAPGGAAARPRGSRPDVPPQDVIRMEPTSAPSV